MTEYLKKQLVESLRRCAHDFTTDEGFVDEPGWTDEQRGGNEGGKVWGVVAHLYLCWTEFAYQLLLTVSSSTLASIRNRLDPLLKRDFIALLPHELAIHVLSLTDAATIGRASSVSKKWKQVTSDHAIWRTLYYRNGWAVNESYLASLTSLQLLGLAEKHPKGSWAIPKPKVPLGEVKNRQGGGVEDDLAASTASSADVEIDQGGSYDEGIDRFEELARDEHNAGGDVTPPNAVSISASSSSSGKVVESPVSIQVANDFDEVPCNIQSESSTLPASSTSQYAEKILALNTLRKSKHTLETMERSHEFDDVSRKLDWKFIYFQRVCLESNWLTGNYVVREFSGHEDFVYCLQFDEDKIISGSRDHSIKIWNMKTGSCQMTLQGHRASVLCLQYNPDYIVSGSSDATIILWSIKDGHILRNLIGHTESVLNLRFDNTSTVSCSKDKTVKIWNTQTGELIRTLRGHRAAVNAIQFKNGLVVSASGDRNIKIWNMETGELLKTLTGHTRGIACVQFDGDVIISGSSG
ncbi:hypothetical protein HDU67_001094 [Dinochytrium kinnereticum]|nr:hypothetical protein HDU67_001094 [Dinochytrium kinnereticum]